MIQGRGHDGVSCNVHRLKIEKSILFGLDFHSIHLPDSQKILTFCLYMSDNFFIYQCIYDFCKK